VLPLQVAVAFGRLGQALPQLPQWERFVRVSTSQPSVAVPLQSSKLVLQVKPHVPLVQVRLEFGRFGQLVVQEPHRVTSVFVLTSHPSVARPLQSAKPELQE
jgi:hypothetical protein